MSIIEDALRRSRKHGGDAAVAGQSESDARGGLATRFTGAGSSNAQKRLNIVPTAPMRLSVGPVRSSIQAPGTDERLVRKEYRAIRQRLLSAVPELRDSERRNGRLLMVASALPNEGKTSVSFHLALSLARHGSMDVVLVDADLAKRHLTKLFGLDDQKGISSFVADETCSLSEIIYPTDADNLYFIPGGSVVSANPEEFEGSRVQTLFDAIKQACGNCVVVFDTGPLLLTSDAPTISSLVDQVLLVVKSGETLRETIKDAIARIDDCVPTSLILNQWQPLSSVQRSYLDAYQYYQKA